MLDLANQRFGKLITIEPSGRNKRGLVMWHCKCDCGGETDVSSTNLVKGYVKSCGCLAAYRDITGEKFGLLTAVERTGSNRGRSIWKCKCDCGNEAFVLRKRLVTKQVQSCGCLTTVKRLEGVRVGRLTVLEEVGRNKHSEALWKCKCDCGNTVIATSKTLSCETKKSCGCLNQEVREKMLTEYHLESKHEGTSLDAIKSGLRKNNKSGICGVAYSNSANKWVAYIRFTGKRHHLGYFKTLEAATEARREAEIEMFDPILIKYGREPTSEARYQEALAKAIEKLKQQEEA